MKCATTTLHAQLAAQRGIFLTDKLDEPDFFSDDERYARGSDWYRTLFQEAAAGDLTGDVSTGYTKLPTDPGTVERMQKDVPDARFVYLMRHPVDRLVSHFIHDWSVGRISVSIDEAVATHRPLVDYGRYAMQLRPYLDAFGSDRVLPVFFERFVTESQNEFERVCRFIGYSGTPQWIDEQGRANASNVRMRGSRLRDSFVSFPGLRTVQRRLVPQGLRDRVKALWSIKDRPELSEDIERRLIEEFDADLAKLGSWLGIDLSCSNFKETAKSLVPVWSEAAPCSESSDA